MTRAHWFTIAAGLSLLTAFFLFDTEEPKSGVTVRMGSTPPALAAEKTVAAISDRGKFQQPISSGQFGTPPGNPDKMFSIASPFAAAAPAPISAHLPDNPGMTMLGANAGGSSPVQVAKENSPAVNGPTRYPGQAPSPPNEFETPPGVGSAKGGQ